MIIGRTTIVVFGPKKFFAQKQSKTFKHCMIVLAGWVGAPRWSAAYYFYPLIFTCPSYSVLKSSG